MKNSKYFGLIVATILSVSTFAQVNPGNSCNTAGCSMGGSYGSLTGSPSMGQYSCLFSTPNPNWLALGIATSGSVNIQLTQVNNSGNPIDVDFALYGPYTSVSAGCPIGPGTPTVDCSYSASATEQINIPNAVAGQVYILLVTNFNGSAGSITLSSLASTGTTNCATNFSGTTSQTPATCNQATGSVSVTPVGGYPPYTYTWNTPGNPTTQSVSNVAPGTYTVTITSSNNPTTGQTVNPTTATVTVLNQNATYSATSTPSSCPGGTNGTATANFNAGGAVGVTATYQWNDAAAQTTQTATGLLPGTYTCTVTLSNGCSGTASTTVGANPVAYSNSMTQVSCPGGSDGTATVNMNPVVGTLSYAWNDPSGQNTQTAIGLSAGTYTCTITSTIGCTGTQNVTVTELPGMVANFTTVSDVTCYADNDGILAVSITNGEAPFTYSWDRSTSTTNSANDLYVGAHIVTITDNAGCIITATESLTEPTALDITFVTPDTQICPEDPITLNAIGTGGSTAYTFTWYDGTTILGTGNFIVVDPSVTNTQYCVVLSEQCGSPTDTKCTMITFPTPIVPRLVPNKPEDCVVGEFEFENTSDNREEIATTFFDFGDLSSTTEIGYDSTSHNYNFVGTYSIYMVTTSIYGCVYEDTIENIVEVLPNPIARFFFSDNPASVFETTVTAYDKSTPDVVTWEWNSPGSIPSSSGLENPKFVFPDGVEGAYEVTLVVTSYHGCTDTLTHLFTVLDDLLFYAPNSFTPDGDEFNQLWRIYVKGTDVNNFNLVIYNRWGEMIWESNDPYAGWDGTYNGKLVEGGTYIWRATMKNVNDDGKVEFNGNINILR